jgi:hypothetical protein
MVSEMRGTGIGIEAGMGTGGVSGEICDEAEEEEAVRYLKD